MKDLKSWLDNSGPCWSVGTPLCHLSCSLSYELTFQYPCPNKTSFAIKTQLPPSSPPLSLKASTMWVRLHNGVCTFKKCFATFKLLCNSLLVEFRLVFVSNWKQTYVNYASAFEGNFPVKMIMWSKGLNLIISKWSTVI